MIICRAFKVELDPNNEQRTALLKHAGAARFAWNWGLARRIEEYKERGKSSNFVGQSRQLNVLKETYFPWMYEVSSRAVLYALRDLDIAYKNFFRRIKNSEKPGFPKFKARKKGIGSFRLEGIIRVLDDSIQLPRLGRIRLKRYGYIPTSGINILAATCSEKAGHWFVSVCYEIEVPDPLPTIGDPVGVDLGIKTMAVVSDGREFPNPRALNTKLRKMRRLQREHARRKKGSNNREKSRQKIAKLHYRIANLRKDALHKVTSAIVKAKAKPSVIVLEDLNVNGMTRNHKLARAISDVGMAEFRRQIEYKAKWNGVEVMIASRFFPSSKTCHVCGAINNNLILDDRKWACSCGAYHDIDLNAAINLSLLATKYRQFDGNSNACGDHVRPTLVGEDHGSRNHSDMLRERAHIK